MLNGKFYMGLPPGMIERGSTQRNRLQSSIFWPDDTKVDSALETRVKRRNSLQIAQNERPQLRMQSSVSGNSGDSTRQLFQKEFSKSSIEFLDNLCDESKTRKPLLLRGNRSAGSEVTPKPTAMKLPLPENVVNAGYTTAKKKQAFTSKIEFYDYMGDELNNRNNFRRTKMDMNDKKEMERNTKNSPKLQVKNNMRSLGTNEKLYPAERREKVEVAGLEESARHADDVEVVPKNNIRDELQNRGDDRYAGERAFDDEFEDARGDLSGYQKNMREHSNRLKDENIRDIDYLENRRTVSPEYGYRRERRFRETYEDDYDVPDYAPVPRYGAAVRRSNSVGRFTGTPKRILRNPIRERRYCDNYGSDAYRGNEANLGNRRYMNRDNEVADSRDYNDCDADLDYMEGRMRNMRIRTSPKKHVTYSDDTYSHDEETPSPSLRRPLASTPQSRARPNMRTGSDQQRQLPLQPQQQQQHDLRRYNSEIDFAEDANEASEQKIMENDIRGSATTIKPLNTGSSYNNKCNNSRDVGNEERNSFVNKINNNKNNNFNNTTSRLNNQTIASAARKITPKIPTTAATTKQNADTATNEQAEAGGGVKKHLRSSLCLHNGEIVASDDGGATSAKAPTRNARTIATRQRISVGLPD
ncbi:PREDICTED: uncharacterized protein DDB_G0283697 [Rhagoletis zephyria]|uniref:uncharacterized protein DDB_G0283697 n=1 Tax=Rhagoletis zephyria TaxID=28612 RepID=UPI0008117AF7|nr:PREDICTED: uncharacterized protein DDB_G0283697 [Rhagoletis zephyria]